jgi:hypothetical protein
VPESKEKPTAIFAAVVVNVDAPGCASRSRIMSRIA